MFECRVGTTHCQLGQAKKNSVEVLEKRRAARSEVIAHYAQTGELQAHIGPSTPRSWDPRCSLQLAFSSPSSLQLAFFVSHPPPLTNSLCPHCHLGIYRCQRSLATRAAASPQRLRQWKDKMWFIDGIDYSESFHVFLTSLYSSCFFILPYWLFSQYISLALANWVVAMVDRVPGPDRVPRKLR